MVRENLVVKQNTEFAVAALAAGDAAKYDSHKRQSGAITPSVCCNGGHAFKHVQYYTGYACADFDDLADEAAVRAAKEKLSRLPYVELCWITASQRGLRVIVPYEVQKNVSAASPSPATPLSANADGEGISVEQFKQVWCLVNEALSKAAGVAYDSKVNDPTRLSFISHDAELYHNPGAVPFPVAVGDLVRNESRKASAKAHRALAMPPPPTLEEQVAQAVRLVEQSEHQCYVEGNRNNYIFRLCAILNRRGVMFDEALSYCRSHYGDLDDKELLSVVKSAYSHYDEFGKQGREQQSGGNIDGLSDEKRGKKSGKLSFASREEVEEFVAQHYETRKNEITNSVEWRYKGDDTFVDLRDYELNSIWRTASIGLHKTVNMNYVWNTLNSEFSRAYNPLEDFLLHHTRPWHRESDPDYVAQLAARVHTTAEPAFFLECLKKWMVGIVAGILSSHKNHTALVLIGPQGIGKTAWCSHLWPGTEAMRRYYLCTANTDFSNKDMKLAFTEFALICLDEVDQLNARELNNLKSLMTAESSQERAAYERTKVRRNHCASICGTGNNKQFLTDTSGNRRWLVFECTDIDDPVNMTVDWEGLYGQLYALWRDGFRYWYNNEEIEQLRVYQSQFEATSPEKELIQRYFNKPDKTYYRSDALGSKIAIVPVFMTSTEILKYISENYHGGLLSVSSVGKAMLNLDYSRTKRDGRWGFVVVPRDTNEIATKGELDAVAAAEEESAQKKSDDEEEKRE